ncbi:MAG TPA: hypothetical protein VKE22_10885 [Haliangiales bacterium]|nr:hypothetical protein [Haliangiales bacterium]
MWVPKPGLARVLSLAENELVADLVWVRTLIYYGDGIIHQTGVPDVDKLVELVNALDPQFRRPYRWGSLATVFRRRVATPAEYATSVKILRRGIEAFPRDWELHWGLGIRLYFDIKGKDAEEERRLREEGAAEIERAMRLPGAPPTLPVTALAMRTRLGQRDRALREMREMLVATDDPKVRAELQRQYADLESQDVSEEMGRAAEAEDRLWQADAPWAPRTFWHVMGTRPQPGIDLRQMARGEEFGAFDASDSEKSGHTNRP